MDRIEKLTLIARQKSSSRRKTEIREIYGKMTMEQLEELADGNATEERIREIFASVGGLNILESRGLYGKTKSET